MPIWIQRLLIALALLLLLLALGIAVLLLRFDGEAVRQLLVEQVARHTQRSLSVEGPVRLSLWPRLGLSLQGVRLSEAGRTETFASVEDARLALRPLPLLLQRRLAVEELSARGLRLVLTRDAEGRRNIDDLLALRQPAEATQSGPAGSAARGTPALAFEVAGLQLDGVELTVRDAQAGLDGQVAIATLRSGRLAEGQPTPIELRMQARLAAPPVDASLALSGQLAFRLPAGQPPSLALDDMNLSLSGEALGIRGIEASLAGALDWDGPAGALAARGLRLKLAAQPPGARIETARLGLETLGYKPAEQRIELAQLALELKGALDATPQRGAQQLLAQLDWPALHVAGQTLGGSALSGSARLSGDTPAGPRELQLELRSQAPQGSFERIVLPGLQLRLTGSEGARRVHGELDASLALRPQPGALDLQPLALQIELKDPTLPPLRLQAHGQAGLTRPPAAAPAAGGRAAAPPPSTVQLRLQGQLNGQAFDSQLRALLGGAGVPRLQAQARFGTLDLSALAPPAPRTAAAAGASGSVGPAAGGASGPPGAGGPAPDAQALDLGPLKALDAELRLSAGVLIQPPHRIEQAELAAVLKAGVLNVQRLDGRAWGGSFRASGSADAHRQRLDLALDASGVEVQALLGSLAGVQPISGRGRLSARLSGQGETVGALRRSLAGQASLQLRDGAVRGLNLAQALRSWRQALRGGDASLRSQAAVQTDFSELSASFTVQDGVARNRDLSAKSPFLRVSGDGSIDLGAGRIDYTARSTVTGTPQGQDGPELAALKGLTVPVKLEGPFEAVDWRIRWSEVGKELLKRQALGSAAGRAGPLGERLLRGGAAAPADAASAPATAPRERVKDALRGLIGR